VEFIYQAGERPDKIYSNRCGWETVISRRLEAIEISVDYNKDESWTQDEVIWTYNLAYIMSADTDRSLLASIQLEDADGNTLPAKTFTYQALEP